MSQFDLNGRMALVTGGAQNLGAAIAKALADAGASVVIGDLKDDVGEATAASMREAGAKASFVHLDITDEDSWNAAMPKAIADLGGLDILVNNAGIEVTALLADFDPAQLRTMLDVNVVGTSLGIKNAFNAMKPGGAAGKGGAVINIASVAALIAFPALSGYSATKSAVDRITRIAAAESGALGYGVRVNCIYPGLIANEMGLKLATDVVELGLYPDVQSAVNGVVGLTPLGHLGEQTDMANAVVFLASDAASFVTGTGLAVDGGMGS
ncbi:SDR family NAD(P)-dependent oxidoreductase [Rathayibacter soli]|uniref:SDR family NAD(P)-dependent oxidoreductase n=1 Tax=Rathayibacter soli TaxID=3144168 RepID=UPI0027E56AC9|nr:SDR family oxidoreductase [Glaciibacter superstes]